MLARFITTARKGAQEKYMKLRNIAAVFAAVITLAACQNPASSDDTPAFAPADPAATARESAKLIEFASGLSETLQSGETVTIDLADYGAALLRVPPAAVLLSSTIAPVSDAPFCLTFPGRINVTVRLVNSSGQRRTIALRRSGAGGISYADGDAGAIFYVGRGVTLEINGDITLEGMNKTRDGISNSAPLVYLASGNLVLDGGARVANNDDGAAGTSRNYKGGGVSANAGSSVVMGDAEIANCSASVQHGGGMGVVGTAAARCSLTMEKTARIVNCYTGSGSGGGGLYTAYADVDMKDDALIKGNWTTGNGSGGGGALVQSNSVFTMSGRAEICENATKGVTGFGGGVRLNGGEFVMQDNAAIRNNLATPALSAGAHPTGAVGHSGGGVYVNGYDSSFEMSGSATISGNVAAGYKQARGGGLYIAPGVDAATNKATTVTFGGQSRVEGNAALIIKQAVSATNQIEFAQFTYGAGSAVYTATYQPADGAPFCEIKLQDSARIVPSAQGALPEAARATFAASDIPADWVLLPKSDTSNAIAVESYYPVSRIPVRVNAASSFPHVIDLANTYVYVQSASLRNGRVEGQTANHTATAWLNASGLVVTLNPFPSVPDLAQTGQSFTFPGVTSLTGTVSGAFTANENQYTLALEITATGGTVTVTGAAASTVTWSTAPTISDTSSWKLVSGASDIMKLSDAQRTVSSGGSATLGRLVPVGDQGSSYGPHVAPLSLSGYTINSSGVIVQR
jgi:hypothetical protein